MQTEGVGGVMSNQMSNQFQGGQQGNIRSGGPFLPPNPSPGMPMGSGPTPSPNSMNQGLVFTKIKVFVHIRDPLSLQAKSIWIFASAFTSTWESGTNACWHSTFRRLFRS